MGLIRRKSPMAESAFEEFVAAGWSGWVRRATLLVGDVGRGEDLLQEALVKLWLAWPRVWDQAPDAYLWRVLVRLANRAGRRRWMAERPTAQLPDVAGSADAGHPTDERDFLLSALGRLPARERAVLVLRYDEDLADVQISQLLGCTAGAVRSAAHRGLTALRKDSVLVDAVISYRPRKGVSRG
ncbi:SigE family RNA polymerase sigma factor [Micromonospora chersina]|uniref:SigE family RNA polymerase sigma factor n=1 Tax=Micromonospora chersina TaxID=47854 RepID=UPI0037B5AEAE